MQIQQERGVSASPSTSERNRKRAGPAAETMGKKRVAGKYFLPIKRLLWIDRKKVPRYRDKKAEC